MHGVLIAVGAEFFQFQSSRRIPTVFHGGITRDSGGALIWIGTTFRTFQRNDDSYAFVLSHNLQRGIQTRRSIISQTSLICDPFKQQKR
jgi:hypothetical protein